MSLLQRRHYEHLARMAREIDVSLKLDGYETFAIRKIIMWYMMKANKNFNADRFAKVAGWLDE